MGEQGKIGFDSKIVLVVLEWYPRVHRKNQIRWNEHYTDK